MWKTETTMSLHDDSSTVLSVRGSDAGHADNQAEKPADAAVPDLYAASYALPYLPCPPQLQANNRSPYVDPTLISLDVGLSKTRYRIHASVLAAAPDLASKPALKLWGEKQHDTVALPELDPVTAHTLVAFLYTGRYATLDWRGDDDKKRVAAYKLAACVYAAAVRYKMSALAELAQERIADEGDGLAIEDMLGVARDCAFPILPEEEGWFAGYLEEAIKRAAGREPGLFMKPGFVDQIEGDRRFRQVVMRAIVGTYSSEGAGGIGGGDHPPMDVKDEGEGVGVVQTPSPAPVVEPQEDHTTTTFNGDNEDTVHLDAIEPTIPDSPAHRPASPLSPAAPESVTDELDFKNSKTYQSMGKPVSHVRHDSVVQAEDIPSVDERKKEEEEVASPLGEVASPASEVVNVNGASATKKSKKKSKKKSGTVFA
jgi:hypothetical protein